MVQDKDTYYQGLLERAQKVLSGKELDLAQHIIKQARLDYYDRKDNQNKLYHLVEQLSRNQTSSSFKPLVQAVKKWLGSEEKNAIHAFSLQPLIHVVNKWLGEEIGALFQYIAESTTDYPYSVGYYRRPFRTSNLSWHFNVVINKLFSILELTRESFNITNYFSHKVDVDYANNHVISDYIAFELDRGNKAIFQALKNIIYGENNTALLDKWMIEGILHSHQPKAYEMVGELLLAARLQEGLRQSIVESMDEGTLEGTLYLLKIIIDHDLIRYSSVIRALDVWTGLNLEAANKRVAKQCIKYVYQALTDAQTREQWLTSNNVDQLYISLWATAVYEENDVEDKIYHLMEHGAHYQKIVAMSFLSQSQNEGLKYDIAHKYLDETDHELQYYMIANLGYHFSYSINYKSEAHEKTLELEKMESLKDKNERARQFFRLKEILLSLPKKELTIQSNVFHDNEVILSTDMIAEKLLYLIAYDMDPDWIAQMIELKDKVGPDVRSNLLDFYIKDLTNPIQREFLFDSLSDKSMTNRETAMGKLSRLDLTDAEVEKVEAILKLKTGTLRQKAIQLLLLLKGVRLEASIDRLLSSKQELQRLGALEMLTELKENPKRQVEFTALKGKIHPLANPTEKEKVFLDKFSNTEEKGWKNGFGLYDPTKVAEVPLKERPIVQLRDVFTLSTEEVIAFLQGLSDLVYEHRNHEYVVEYYGGYKETLLLGSDLRANFNHDDGQPSLDRLPLSEIWKQYFQEKGVTTEQMVHIRFLLSRDDFYRYYFNKMNRWEREHYPALTNTRKELVSHLYPIEQIEQVESFNEKTEYTQQVFQIVDAYFEDLEKPKAFEVLYPILYSMAKAIPGSEQKNQSKFVSLLVQPWLEWTEDFVYDEASFSHYFAAIYYLYRSSNYKNFSPSIEDFARAYECDVIDDEEVYRELFSREESSQHYWKLTNERSELLKKYPSMLPIKERAIETILEIELSRGELPTDVTPLAINISKYEGIEYFVKILLGTDKESFVRGYIYSYDGKASKKETFSHLLKVCYPKQGENEAMLAELLKGKKVSDKRLLEAAMYAPQWIEIVSKYLQWDGLRSAAWYFHAHMNESFSAEKETIVAHYSPIKPEDFNDGAFDIAWFKEAYQELGEKRFKVLYDAAKYISAGANHRRSQLFADATLGKLSLSDMKKSASEKRNKDHLLVVSLIPIDSENERDVLDRYEFLQAFLQESKKFGSARRASESKVVGIALENLARNAGYKDVTRLIWEMEAKKLEEIQPLLEPKNIDELTLHLVIDPSGKADIHVSKNGKALKSIPSKYNKHEYVMELKSVKTDLTNQYKRAKVELERSMVMQNSFTLAELTKMMNNPVISPLLESLVFKVEEQLGYFVEGRLVNVTGEDVLIESDDELLIAHPVHLYESGLWSDFQRDLFDRRVKQTFKQVFRELYVPNQDELAAGTASMRYAGHQVQPGKTVALLKGRNWTVSYEEGLQKVFYKENMIAKVYAMADWFSPSDIESPTLETVEFFDRHTYKSVELKDVPKLLFSETMRDVDLVVSVAHVGGVDPEASLTTIEMRRSIVSESIRLLKLDNVRVDGNFALIEGSLGEYSVHLGSANAYKQASGALFIVPVHSQHRGRVFLPFMDEDPKTAEIVSKILMLAEDKKIKDPYILGQIK
ncbi:DUF4132 domain-containing protein [Neobacillus drentensis]|uniref:DUF4132 domain-containing protein n=1 Tax=Neobacillus drentensis TaxID=220684 RepID=UPI002FFE5922